MGEMERHLDPLPATREVLTLQYLRGFAAMAVVYFHVALGFHGRDNHSVSQLGACGVDLFFVISGFIMFYISHLRTPTPYSFACTRLLRIAPIYWLVTFAMFFMPLVSKTVGWSSTLDARHLTTSLLFVGGVQWPGVVGTFPVYRAGWTINYEIFFYILFAIGLFFRPISRTILFVSASLIILVVSGILLNPYSHTPQFYTAPILMEFVYGMAIAAAFMVGWRLPWPAALISIILGLSGLFLWADIPDTRLWAIDRGIPAASIVVGAVSLERVARMHSLPVMKLLGDASYSIYLTHLFSLPIFEMTWARALRLTSEMVFAYFATALAVAAAVGVVVYLIVERPLHRWARRAVRGDMRVDTNAPRTKLPLTNPPMP